MPTITVSKNYVEYTGEHLYSVKIRYYEDDPDNLVEEVHMWVKNTFTEDDYDTWKPGYWYLTTNPVDFALAFKLCWGDVNT